MIPNENNLGVYIRYLRDNGIADAIGDWKENDGEREFGVRIRGVFYPVAELTDTANRAAVLKLDFARVLLNRAAARVRRKQRTRTAEVLQTR